MQFFKDVCLIISNFLFDIHKTSLKAKKSSVVDFTKERKQVATLIMDVLVGKICVREALLRFPKNCEDKAVAVAWHALVHFEADEDIVKSDRLFKDVQVDFLEGLYNILIEGHDLPENLLKGYNKYHNHIDTAYSPRKADFWHEIKKNLNIYE